MYLDYWGLAEKPFENTPNPRFLYPSQQHREGLRKLLYAISEEKGCGKTHLIRTVVKNLGADYEVAIINCSSTGRTDSLVARIRLGRAPCQSYFRLDFPA